MGRLNELAEHGGGLLRGIDWENLERRGVGGVWHADYYMDYMRPAFREVVAVKDSINIDVDWTNAVPMLAAYREVADQVTSTSSSALEAIQAGAKLLPAGAVMQLGTEVLRFFVAQLYWTIVAAIYLHRESIMQLDPEVPDDTIIRHAELTTRMCHGLLMLDRAGVLKPIKRPGLGIAPAVIVGAVVVLVAAVAVLAWLILSMQTVAKVNEEAKRMCAYARATGDKKAYNACVELTQTAASAGTKPPSLPSGAWPWLVGGGLVILGVYFAPLVIRQLKAAGKEARKKEEEPAAG
jgi:hypothetical protein